MQTRTVLMICTKYRISASPKVHIRAKTTLDNGSNVYLGATLIDCCDTEFPAFTDNYWEDGYPYIGEKQSKERVHIKAADLKTMTLLSLYRLP